MKRRKDLDRNHIDHALYISRALGRTSTGQKRIHLLDDLESSWTYLNDGIFTPDLFHTAMGSSRTEDGAATDGTREVDDGGADGTREAFYAVGDLGGCGKSR
jgi:hypothetical protein